MLLRWAALFALAVQLVGAYEVLISDEDVSRQVCTGMWGKLAGSRDPYIEVLFGPGSKGQLALVIYEWKDAKYLGVDEVDPTEQNEWEDNRLYVCTYDAVAKNLCPMSMLGQFITTMPAGVSVNSTSIFTRRVEFTAIGGNETEAGDGMQGPFRYNVTRTGYYCVGAVPLVSDSITAVNGSLASTYTGVVDFENVFKGLLTASEYPKVAFYAVLFFVYVLLGIVWTWNYWRHRSQILAVQNYISATIAFIIVEIAAVSAYYKYVNDIGHPVTTHILLVLVSVLSSARNAISFFMLLIVSLGYGIVKPTLGRLMIRARLLAVAHFIFGVAYSLGLTLALESDGFWLLFMIFPLAFTLTGFMMWIMSALSLTIRELDARKQTYKKQMFTRLYRILIGAAIIIVAFFVISSIAFSNRLDEDFAPDTWKTRWFLFDGWLGLLYLFCFAAIAYLWRPTGRNRYLMMSDEVAQDEGDAELYEAPGDEDDDEDGKGENGHDAIPLRGRGVGDDAVVFDIGEDDDDDEGRRRSSKEGEHRPLRLSDSSDRPPAYR